MQKSPSWGLLVLRPKDMHHQGEEEEDKLCLSSRLSSCNFWCSPPCPLCPSPFLLRPFSSCSPPPLHPCRNALSGIKKRSRETPLARSVHDPFHKRKDARSLPLPRGEARIGPLPSPPPFHLTLFVLPFVTCERWRWRRRRRERV